MNSALLKSLVSWLIDAILLKANADEVKSMIDDALDYLEDKMADRPDMLKIISSVRGIISVPDDFGGDTD